MKDKTVHLNLKPSGGDLISESYLMDCILGMKEYPDKYFDLAVVDPPYGIGEAGGRCRTRKKHNNKVKHTKKNWDNERPKLEYWIELIRVSKNQIVWGANYFTEYLPPSMGWIFWDKQIGGDFSDGELAYTSFNRALKMFTKWAGNNGIPRIHPTQKPVELYDWIFLNYAEPNHKILDTHLGSGSSRIAAHKNGLHFVGFEIDEEYYYMQEGRFENYLRQPTLFSIPRAVGVLNSNAPTLNFEQSTEL
jgi:site-specific DNA-methyltransferase (adenine-specific)